MNRISSVVVTGSSGFIGYAVCEELKRRNIEPIPFDRSRDQDVLRTPIPEADAVIHLSGVLGTAELFDVPELAVDVNVKGTLKVLEACRDQDMGFVGITMPDVFPSVYTATKIASQRLASAFHTAYDIPVSHVRAFNAFGPGQKHGLGHPQKIVPTFALAAWRGVGLPVWGDGNQTVDLVYVDDVARMLVDALSFENDEIFDAGTGHAFTVNEVAELVIGITGSGAGIEYWPMRKGELESKIVAEGAGWDLLGWKPEFRKEDLALTVNFYLEAA